jgi:hypothetical protein
VLLLQEFEVQSEFEEQPDFGLHCPVLILQEFEVQSEFEEQPDFGLHCPVLILQEFEVQSESFLHDLWFCLIIKYITTPDAIKIINTRIAKKTFCLLIIYYI